MYIRQPRVGKHSSSRCCASLSLTCSGESCRRYTFLSHTKKKKKKRTKPGPHKRSPKSHLLGKSLSRFPQIDRPFFSMCWVVSFFCPSLRLLPRAGWDRICVCSSGRATQTLVSSHAFKAFCSRRYGEVSSIRLATSHSTRAPETSRTRSLSQTLQRKVFPRHSQKITRRR